jgi:hypothetical protein
MTCMNACTLHVCLTQMLAVAGHQQVAVTPQHVSDVAGSV